MKLPKFSINLSPITKFLLVALAGISVVVMSFGLSEMLSGDNTTEYNTKAMYSKGRAVELSAIADIISSTAAPIAALSALLIGGATLFASICLGGGTLRLLLAVSRSLESNAEATKVERVSRALKTDTLKYLTYSVRDIPLAEVRRPFTGLPIATDSRDSKPAVEQLRRPDEGGRNPITESIRQIPNYLFKQPARSAAPRNEY